MHYIFLVDLFRFYPRDKIYDPLGKKGRRGLVDGVEGWWWYLFLFFCFSFLFFFFFLFSFFLLLFFYYFLFYCHFFIFLFFLLKILKFLDQIFFTANLARLVVVFWLKAHGISLLNLFTNLLRNLYVQILLLFSFGSPSSLFRE